MSSFGMHKALAEKNPKSLISIIEACNGYKTVADKQIRFLLRQSIGDDFTYPFLYPGVYLNIRKLFTNGCRLIVTAGQPGMDTWSTNFGSIFSNNFARSFDERMLDQKTEPSWLKILEDSKSYTSAETYGSRLEHYPVWSPPKCNMLISQSIEEDSLDIVNIKPVQEKLILIVPSSLHRKRPLGPKKYRNFDLSIPNAKDIDSVTYFLHHTFNDSIVTIKRPETHFAFRLKNVWGGFPIKYWVYYNDGRRKELWDEIIFYKSDGTVNQDEEFVK